MKTPGLFVVVAFLLACSRAADEVKNKGWWKNGVFYQVYPRSFMDSNADGVGDLKGIISKIQHFKDIGVTGIWLSPINKSPMVDAGYDISDFRDVDSTFGNLADLEELIKEAHALGLKVILDLVPNHTSDQHEWFVKSVANDPNYADYYIWNNGKPNVNGNPLPPNNWLSVFNGSAWTYHEQRKQLYFHQFYKQQPDLNYANPKVQEEMKQIMKFWLDKQIDGFRIDAVPHLFEGDITKDEPPSNMPGAKPTEHISLDHTLTKDQPATYTLVKSWRDYVDDYAKQNSREEILIMTEAYTSLGNTLKYYEFGSHVPFNFKFITNVNSASPASVFKATIDDWIKGVPQDGVANWVMGNHDRVRVASRYPGRADQMTMLAMMLPGVAVTYYGEEIGMVDHPSLTIKDFRDPCRTPFQWDNTTNAGFSKSSNTWLPVHPDYKNHNLMNQKNDPQSHYHLYKELVKLRQSPLLRNSVISTDVLHDQVLAVTRSNATDAVMLLINLNNNDKVTVNITGLMRTLNAKVLLTNVGSDLKSNVILRSAEVEIPAKASIILMSSAKMASPCILAVLFLTIVALFRS